MQTFTLIAAVAANGTIGRQGQLVFTLPGDLARFKALTLGKPVVMGRKTWEGLPKKPLPGRRNVVLTHNPAWQAAGAETVKSPQEALTLLAGEPDIAIIGGADVYDVFLPLATHLLLTEVHEDTEGDAVFPPFDKAEWQETERTPGNVPGATPTFDYVTYTRR